MTPARLTSFVGLLALALAATAPDAAAITVDSYYAGSYTATSLGSAPGLPPLYGGLTVSADDPSVLLIGGNANTAAGALYSVGVTRDVDGHIDGFTGATTLVGGGEYNDGGVIYGPGGVLFLARWPVNELGQMMPGSTVTDKVIDLTALGVAPSPGGAAFVPAGYGGAGHLKLVSWAGGQWYDAEVTPDGTGTYDLENVTYITTIGGGPEGIAYVPLGSTLFASPSLLVSEYSAGTVGTYEVDANGDPILASRRDFITGLSGAEGAAIDPWTGDFLFSTFGSGDQIVVVRGFNVPPPTVPEPTTLALAGLGAVAALVRRRA